MPTHEVWLELTSGTRVLVGTELPDIPAANALATHWKDLAENSPNELHETERGSGVVVRGSAIVAIKAQEESKAKTLGGLIKAPREGSWL
jgi:hypothetical protein